MTRLLASLLLMMALPACGGDGGGSPNPPQLWLNYNGDELHVKLQPIMPNPF